MKLRCNCGHIISDSTDYLPYKAKFIKDRDADAEEKSIEDICSFMEAYKEGKKEEWIADYFDEEMKMESESNNSVIAFIRMINELKYENNIYQC